MRVRNFLYNERRELAGEGRIRRLSGLEEDRNAELIGRPRIYFRCPIGGERLSDAGAANQAEPHDQAR